MTFIADQDLPLAWTGPTCPHRIPAAECRVPGCGPADTVPAVDEDRERLITAAWRLYWNVFDGQRTYTPDRTVLQMLRKELDRLTGDNRG